MAILETPRSFAELIDRCRGSDLEAMRAVKALLDHGLVRQRAGRPVAEAAPMLAPHELHALRARIARGRSSGTQTVGKVVVAGGGPLARRAALSRFCTVPGFVPVAGGDAAGFGTIGRLALGDGVRVDLVGLPGEPTFLPLWRPFAAGAVGALVLLPADGLEPLLEELARTLKLPVVVSGPSEEWTPELLRSAPAGFAFEGSDPAEGLRALLAGAGARPLAY